MLVRKKFFLRGCDKTRPFSVIWVKGSERPGPIINTDL